MKLQLLSPPNVGFHYELSFFKSGNTSVSSKEGKVKRQPILFIVYPSVCLCLSLSISVSFSPFVSQLRTLLLQVWKHICRVKGRKGKIDCLGLSLSICLYICVYLSLSLFVFLSVHYELSFFKSGNTSFLSKEGKVKKTFLVCL